MALKLKASTSSGQDGDFEVPEADIHYAVLVAAIDLGTHTKTYMGGDSNTKRRFAFVWELDAKKSTGASHFVAKEYTYSGDVKASLRIDLGKCRGKPYEDGEDIVIEKAVGSAWSITISHQEKDKDGKKKVYYKIESAGAIKKGARPPKPTVEPFYWEIGCPDPVPDYEWMPRIFGDKIKDLIEISPEWKALQSGGGDANGEEGRAGTGAGEDDIPF